MEPDQQAPAGHQFAVGVISVLMMLLGVFLAVTDDVAIGASLLAIGAAITPSVAWWRRRNGSR